VAVLHLSRPLAYLPTRALASTSSQCEWNSRRLASISAFVVCASTWNMRSSSSRRHSLSTRDSWKNYVCVSRDVSTACRSTCVPSNLSVSSLRRPCVFWSTHNSTSSIRCWIGVCLWLVGVHHFFMRSWPDLTSAS
jgi:hypothetical protein